jgi:hypothetical protein
VKYSIQADVVGELYLEQPNTVVRINVADAVYEFRSDEVGRLSAITVTVAVPPSISPTMHATFGPQPEDPCVARPLTVHVDPLVDEDARRRLLGVESLLSHMTDVGNPLVSVNAWEGATTLVPETPEEQERVQVWGISVGRSPQRRRTRISQQVLAAAVAGSARYGDLVESMAFMRDGTNRQIDGEFIQAFYSYYFVIEGLYADGRSSEPEILKRFAMSPVFRLACRAAAASYFGPNTPRTQEVAVLRPLMASYKCAETPEGLQRFFIRMRQQLHHFSRRSSKMQPHPFNQQAFEPIADLTRFVARLAIELEVKRIDGATIVDG